MHCTQHAGDEFVDTVALLDQGHKRSDPAFVVSNMSEVGEDQLLELLDLVLQRHEVRDSLVAFIGVVDGLQADILLVFESTVEFEVRRVERKLCQQVENVFVDQGAVTTNAFASHTTLQAINPVPMSHCLSQGNNMSFLKHAMDGNEGLERLYFVGENWLAVYHLFSKGSRKPWPESCTYTLIPAQKAWDDL